MNPNNPRHSVLVYEVIKQTIQELITNLDEQVYQYASQKSFYNPPEGRTTAKRIDCKEIRKRLSQDAKDQNQAFINFKQVCTSVITHWLKQYNLREVQYMEGHRHVSSTEAYLVNHMEDLRADIDEFYPF